MLTVTAVVSLAVPVNEGVESLERTLTSWFKVTVGAVVSTVKITGTLVPSGLPASELFCDATAVYVCFPVSKAGLAGLDVHASPTGVAVASDTGVPVGRSPSNTLIVTGVVSLAVPVNDGVRWFDGEVGCASVTVGAAVFTLNVAGALRPSGLPAIELRCVAIAVYCPSASGWLTGAELQLPDTTDALKVRTGVPLAAGPL